MMGKRQFGRSKWLLIPIFALTGCQSAPQSGTKAATSSLAVLDFQAAKAQISHNEIANGDLGWVSVSVPVVQSGETPKEFEVKGRVVSQNRRSQKVQEKGDEDSKSDQVVLHFFEPSTSQSSQARLFHAWVPIPYRHALGAATIKIQLRDQRGQQELDVPFRVIAGKYRSEKLKVDPSRVHPSAQDSVRIAREAQEIGAVYRNIESKRHWQGPFLLPITSSITSPFGTRRIYNGALASFHTGLDLRAAIGTPILSAAPGRVAMAKDLFMTGNTVILDHGFGVMTLYAHMSKIKVKSGDLVDSKQLLGLSGNTGRVNGPHLHWMAIVDGVKVNPISLTQEAIP